MRPAEWVLQCVPGLTCHVAQILDEDPLCGDKYTYGRLTAVHLLNSNLIGVLENGNM